MYIIYTGSNCSNAAALQDEKLLKDQQIKDGSAAEKNHPRGRSKAGGVKDKDAMGT